MMTSPVEKDAVAQRDVGLSQPIPESSTQSPLSAKDIHRDPRHPTPVAAVATTRAATATSAPAPATSSDLIAQHQASETAPNPTPKILSSTTVDGHSPPSRLSSSPSPPNPPKSPAALNLSSKITHLQTQISALEQELSTTHTQLESKLASKPSFRHPPGPALDPASAAETIVKRHIKLLHDYNELKDIGLGLMGLIADARDVRLGPVMAEFGVDVKD